MIFPGRTRRHGANPVVVSPDLLQLIGPDLLRVRSEIVDKVWREAEDSPVWPQVHFIAKSDIGRRDPATV